MLAKSLLGFGHETVQYLNGGHRDICKFDNPEDPNYITIKNALATAISSLLEEGNLYNTVEPTLD